MESLKADVLVPELGVIFDEVVHEGEAVGILGDFDFDSLGAENVFLSHEGLILADDDFWNAVEEDGSAAHGAGGEGGVELAFAIDGSALAAGVFEGIHFTMEDGAIFLNAAVVAPPEDFSLVDEDAADGDAAFSESKAGFQKCFF